MSNDIQEQNPIPTLRSQMVSVYGGFMRDLAGETTWQGLVDDVMLTALYGTLVTIFLPRLSEAAAGAGKAALTAASWLLAVLAMIHVASFVTRVVFMIRDRNGS